MATMRRHVFCPRSADEVWELVGDPARVAEWFPHMVEATVETTAQGTHRAVTLGSGLVLQEEIVTVRDDLRRMQYRLTGPLPVEHHLATIDVLADGEDRCVVVYGTDVVPHALAFILDGAVGEALDDLARRMGRPDT